MSISIYNFSGYSQGSAKYKPGSRGLIDPANPSLGVHYRIEVDNIYLSNINKSKCLFNLRGGILKGCSLDGALNSF